MKKEEEVQVEGDRVELIILNFFMVCILQYRALFSCLLPTQHPTTIL